MPVSISGTNGVTFPDSSLQTAAASPYVLKNRIINGDMRIDQRNAGASFTPTDNNYGLDRYRYALSQASKLSAQQSSVAPTGFGFSYLHTVTSAVTVGSGDIFSFYQPIEGFNTADLAFGTASAATVTLSFWVRSSVTGTFSVALLNSAANRSYVSTYTISSANTWEQKSITVVGDTTGTWVGATNGIGLRVYFDLGSGSTYTASANSWQTGAFVHATGSTNLIATSGATFYITGVQLEAGSTATPFERRLYNQELANCQRYCFSVVSNATAVYARLGSGFCYATTAADIYVKFPVEMRTAPSLTTTGTASNYAIYSGSATVTACNSIPTVNTNATTTSGAGMTFLVASGFTAGQGANAVTNNASNIYLIFSSEL